MSNTVKIIIAILVLIVIAFGVAFFTARYLVSKLDGTGGAVATSSLERYSSEDGVTFYYPDTYELSSRQGGTGERFWDVLTLLPKGYVPPVGGEGPPAISMSVFQNIEGYPIETWVRGDARSNFKLSSDEVLTNMTVGGEPALAYQHSGLYEADAVAVAHGGKIFLFEAGWIGAQDPIRTDFQNLIKSVQFSL